MTLTRKALATLAAMIFLCCAFAFSLLRSESRFQQVKLVLDMERQEAQEVLREGWRVFYHDEWATIETFMEEPTASLEITLPLKDIYLMKIKARFGQVGQRVEVLVNGAHIGSLIASKAGRAEKLFLKVPAIATHPGRNVVVFQQPSSTATIAFEKIVLTNFQFGDRTTMVLSWRTSPQLAVRWSSWAVLFIIWLGCALVECATVWWLSRIIKLPLGLLVVLDLFSYVPLVVCMAVLLSMPLVSPYRVVINPSWFAARVCLILVGIPKLYLLGVVSKRYAELVSLASRRSLRFAKFAGRRYAGRVQRAVAYQQANRAPKGRVDYTAVWTSSADQSLLVLLGAVGVLIVIDVHQRWERLRRRLRWLSRLQPGNEWLLGFLGLWVLAALTLIVGHLPHLSEQIVNVAAIFLVIAVIAKSYALWDSSYGQ